MLQIVCHDTEVDKFYKRMMKKRERNIYSVAEDIRLQCVYLFDKEERT